MKKIIALLFCACVSLSALFAGKPVSKEPSPLSALESETERKSWNEYDGYTLVMGRNLHYWLYDSYMYHDGDISDLVFRIVPKWFQSMGYSVFENYDTYSPNRNLADSVKKLMEDFDSDVSITFVKTDEDKSDYVAVNSYDRGSEIYSTYIFYGTKTDNAKISSGSNETYEAFIQELVKALNKNGKDALGDKFYENLKSVQAVGKKVKRVEDMYGNTLPDTAYEYIVSLLYERAKKKNANKYYIDVIQLNTPMYYGVSQNFKITVSMSNSFLAKTINSLTLQ